MPRKEYHIQRTPIPEGYQIYEEWLEVAGVHRRRADVIAFIKGRDPWLEFELEPTNRRDPNAIKVIGCTKGLFGPERRHIGYVPAELAARIAKTGLRELVKPRLWKTYLGDDGYVEVGFQLLGPVGHEARGAFGTSGRHARSSTGP